jgi:CO dehydrogenase/acetyl-CoA synthase epsilon subunit
MSRVNAIRATFEQLRSLGFAGISGAYAPIGVGFLNPIRMLKITNMTDQDVIISFDGVIDHDIVIAAGFTLYDFSTNMSTTGGYMELPEHTIVYAKTAGVVLPLSGSIYVTAIYAK